MEAMKADVARLTAEVDRLQKGLDEAGYVVSADVIEKKATVEMIEVGGVSIAKSDIPAPVLKALEDAEISKKQHEIEKADIELTKRAGETLPHFDVDVAKSLLKSFADDKAIVEALKAADAAFAAAMGEVGKSAIDGSFANASDEMEALVKSYMDENNMKKSDHAKAYAAVAKTDKGKALINKSYKGE
jgi:predicted transcriptional regulator